MIIMTSRAACFITSQKGFIVKTFLANEISEQRSKLRPKASLHKGGGRSGDSLWRLDLGLSLELCSKASTGLWLRKDES